MNHLQGRPEASPKENVMTYEERLAKLKEVECELRAAQIELTNAINTRNFTAMKSLQKECVVLKHTIMAIAEPVRWGNRLERPIDKRLYTL